MILKLDYVRIRRNFKKKVWNPRHQAIKFNLEWNSGIYFKIIIEASCYYDKTVKGLTPYCKHL